MQEGNSTGPQGLYRQEEASAPQYTPAPQDPQGYMFESEQSVVWTASEFIAHQKSANWYLTLAFSAIIVAALVWLMTRDVVSAIVILFGALALGVYAGREPRSLRYELNGQGLAIGERFFPYSDFKSFAILEEGAIASIALTPLKRFAPMITLYFAPDDEEAIITKLSGYLPIEEGRHDLIDRLMQRIRF